jgi:PEP-CTERM motif
MRGKNVLCACWRSFTLAFMFASTAPALGSTVNVGVDVYASGTYPDPNSIFACGCTRLTDDHTFSGSGSGSASGSSSAPSASAVGVGVAASPSTWTLLAEAGVAGSADSRGPVGIATVAVVITDQVTINVPPGVNPNDELVGTGHFFVNGDTSGSAAAPGYFAANIGATIFIAGQEVFDSGENLTSDGYDGDIRMPRGDIVLKPHVRAGQTIGMAFSLTALAYTYAVEDQGSANAKSDFSHTFQWGDITEVFDATTGQPVAAEDFHLIGDDGFDWAHPSTVPEPATLGMAIVAAAAFFCRRTKGDCAAKRTAFMA